MQGELHLGLIYSRSGSYVRLADAARRGALRAVADLAAQPGAGPRIRLHERDPGGEPDRYAPAFLDLNRAYGVRHVLGAITSASRKELIPALDRAGATLWYGAPYEGFEAADSVAYLHSTVNQNVIPLLDWALPRLGARGFLTGSNYVWGWEINRIARARIAAAGGAVLGERNLPLADLDVGPLVAGIARHRPDFVLNSLVGETQYRFLGALRQVLPDCPVLSCNLTEAEIGAIGAAAEGLYSVGPYFARLGPEAGRFADSFERAAYLSVLTLARLWSAAGARPDMTLDDLLALAPCEIDPVTHHAAQPVFIARWQGGQFHQIHGVDLVAADPYLARQDTGGCAPLARPRLRVVR